jgi:hypothetical protein
MTEKKTPMLDELVKGPWPSFVTHMKKAAEKMILARIYCYNWNNLT